MVAPMRGLLRRSQFKIAYLLLALVAGGLGALTPLIFAMEKPAGPKRAELRVDALTVKQQMKQIGDYTTKRYRLNTSGDPLVNVLGDQGAIVGQQFDSVVFVGDGTGQPKKVSNDKVAAYVLCGEGSGCTVAGKPTQARGCLLFHEAFELAYQSFVYLKGVDFVVVVLPVDYANGKVSLVFTRASFASLPQKKLATLMGFDTPPLPGAKGACTFSKAEQSVQTFAISALGKINKEVVLTVVSIPGAKSAQMGGKEK